MVYGLAWSDKPGLPQDGLAWMGGNVLFGFQQSNPTSLSFIATPSFCVPLPKKSVGMRPIPGGPGGALVGIDPEHGTVGHYTKEGLVDREHEHGLQVQGYENGAMGRGPSRLPIWRSIATALRTVCSTSLWRIILINALYGIAWMIPTSRLRTQIRLAVPAVPVGGYLLTVNNGIGDGKYPKRSYG